MFAGPSSGRVLLTRTGNVTKLEGTALQLDFSRASRAYELKYTRSERMRLQSSAVSGPTLKRLSRRPRHLWAAHFWRARSSTLRALCLRPDGHNVPE